MKIKSLVNIALSALLVMSLASCTPEAEVINSVEELNNKDIGVQTGSTGEIYANEKLDADVSGYASYTLAVEDLKAGRIDAVICDSAPADALVKADPTKLKILDEKLSTEQYAIAVRKGDTESLNAINSALAEIKTNGTYDILMSNYFAGEEPIVTPPVIQDPIAGQKVWRVGTDPNFKPYEYIDNDQIVGFDMELAAEIAEINNWCFQPKNIGFSGLILSLQNNDIDAIVSGLSVTEERKKTVDFSDPYFESSLVVIVANE